MHTLVALPDPVGLAVDSTGLLAVVLRAAQRIVLVGSAGVTVLAGSPDGQAGYAGDGGPGDQALLREPARATFTSAGQLVLADTGNRRLRLLNPVGQPAAPRLAASLPASPSRSTQLAVRGAAPQGAGVTIQADKECLSRPVGSGTATELAGPGIPLEPVVAEATTELFALATLGGNVSGCSTLPLRYVADGTAPVPPSVGPPDPQSRRSPVFPVRAEVGTTLDCQLRRGEVEVERGGCGDAYAPDLAGQPDGDYRRSPRPTRLVDAARGVG